jgi:hypothetical protein
MVNNNNTSKTVKEILYNIAINKNTKAPSHVAYHGTGARFYQYDPAFALTGEGANKYGRGFYSGSIPEIGEFYKNWADSHGKAGTVYQVNLPEQYKYYNTDLPLAQQSDWVRGRLAAKAQPVDYSEYFNDLKRTNRFETLYDDFLKATGREPKYTNEILEFINQQPEKYMKEVFNPMGATSGTYSKLNRTLKDLGIVGTTHYKPNGAHVNITFDPKDIEIIQPNEVGIRMTANRTDTNKTFNELLQGYRRAFNPLNRTVLQNPYTRAALRALGTTGEVLGPIGDAVMIYEASRLAKQKMIEDYDKLPIEQKQLIGNHIGMNPRVGENWKGLKLPLIQVNDNTLLLKGGVKYDDYMLEPLGDDVYMQGMPDEKFNN